MESFGWTIFLFTIVVSLSITIVLILFRLKKKDAEIDLEIACNGVSVVIPARNEERAIEKSIRSLLKLKEVVLEIIVVDDNSEDLTWQIVKNLSKQDNRVRLTKAPELPKHWLGKTHALHFGAQLAKSDYILFTDADVEFSGHVIQKALSIARQNDLDHIGSMFSIKCCSISEGICAPILVVMATTALSLASWFGTGAGTGAFNLIKKSTYLSVGGHKSIKGHIVDDVALARMIKAYGGKSLFIDLASGIRVRLFKGFLGYWKAISRSAIPFLGWPIIITIPLTAFLIVHSVYLLICPTITLLVWILSYTAIAISFSDMITLPLMTYIIGLLPVLLGLRYSSGYHFFALLYPLSLILMIIAVAVAAFRFKLNLPLEWRGRSYEANVQKNSFNRRSLK